MQAECHTSIIREAKSATFHRILTRLALAFLRPHRAHWMKIMDKNRTEGAKHQVKGTVREVAGKVTGNKSKEVSGKVEKNVGKVQRNVGEAADEIRNEDKRQRKGH